MCEFFVKADPIQYEQRTRSVRIHGVLTSIRLENMVWDILAEIAEEENGTTNSLISKLHDEILASRGEVPNFASVRVDNCAKPTSESALRVTVNRLRKRAVLCSTTQCCASKTRPSRLTSTAG